MEWVGIRGVLLKDIPMKRYTSMRVGGPVKYLFYPLDEADLANTMSMLRDKSIPYRFLGNGTNVIIADKGMDAALIRITKIRHTRYKKEDRGAAVEVSGGASLKAFIRENAARGLAGLEHLFWIPGTVGGAVKMNAGSFGTWISERLRSIRVVAGDGKVCSLEKDGAAYGYRRSPVEASECVLSASFLLEAKDRSEIEKEMAYVVSRRKEKHPMEFPSAGSVFKSVNGEPAWKFIDRAGLRGLRIGNAAVSEKHANFIINLGSATAQDVKVLIERIKKEVYEKLGVTLSEEVELWGFDE